MFLAVSKKSLTEGFINKIVSQDEVVVSHEENGALFFSGSDRALNTVQGKLKRVAINSMMVSGETTLLEVAREYRQETNFQQPMYIWFKHNYPYYDLPKVDNMCPKARDAYPEFRREYIYCLIDSLVESE